MGFREADDAGQGKAADLAMAEQAGQPGEEGRQEIAIEDARQELAYRGIDRNDIEDALVEFEEWDESEAIREILQRKYAEAMRQEKGRRRAFSALQQARRLRLHSGGILPLRFRACNRKN